MEGVIETIQIPFVTLNLFAFLWNVLIPILTYRVTVILLSLIRSLGHVVLSCVPRSTVRFLSRHIPSSLHGCEYHLVLEFVDVFPLVFAPILIFRMYIIFHSSFYRLLLLFIMISSGEFMKVWCTQFLPNSVIKLAKNRSMDTSVWFMLNVHLTLLSASLAWTGASFMEHLLLFFNQSCTFSSVKLFMVILLQNSPRFVKDSRT